jgi:predicted ABC-type ATPase
MNSNIRLKRQLKKNTASVTKPISTPLHWLELFKKNGYDLHLIFLCLDSIDEAKKRVAIRVENGGHFVPETEIEKRYQDGYTNLNSFFDHFDYIDLFDSSKYLKHITYFIH